MKLFGDLSIQTNKKLKLFNSASTFSTNLRSNASISADLDFVLPSADGSSGQVLSTNGSGVLSFVTKVSGPGSTTDNRLVRMDGTTGALIQDSTASLDDSGNLSGVVAITATGQVQGTVLKATTSVVIEDPGAGTNTVTLQAPSGLAGSYTLTLPVDDGNSGQVLRTDGSGALSWVNQSTISSFKATWATADGTTKTVTHNLASTDIMIQVFDIASGESIQVDTMVRTDANTLTLTASEAPPAGSWRVLILAV